MARALTAYEFLAEHPATVPEKPLPALPGLPASPTLTNPDMVLPDHAIGPALPSSPPSSRGRPPSPSYLKDDGRNGSRSATPTPKKEKRGLMSRKMMLLRSRTSSASSLRQQQQQQQQAVPRSTTFSSDRASEDSMYASSPTLMDVGNLAPERPLPAEEKRLSTSGSSFNSEELTGIPSFLAKYESTDGAGTGDELSDSDSAAVAKYGYSVRIEGGNYDAQRRQQEEDEHQSAMLSKRAEQILANAKKRLNLMEGNLRGARDLVAPLTAANLKRATSLGSSTQSPYNGRSRFVADAHPYDSSIPKHMRTLHAQASSPTMGRDYSGHARNFSGTEVPDRPHTALARSNSGLRNGRIPVRVNDGSWAQGLRSSKSHDSLGSNVTRERSLRPRGSPDPTLEPLPEDGHNLHAITHDTNETGDENPDGLGIDEQPSTKTENLREQMSSLKGKISTLKERAREDSLRRQSLMNLRTPTPLNNATASPPEFFYLQNQSYETPPLDTNAGGGWTAQQQSPASSQSPRKLWGQPHAISGSRNAFAEQAVRQHRPAQVSPGKTPPSRIPHRLSSDARSSRSDPHKRTPSGTAIIEPASNRFSHHQYTSNNKNASNHRGDGESQINVRRQKSGSLSVGQDVRNEYDEEGGSVYEDAEYEQPAVVAHEDREDAFDYEHFFLHSAMGSYSGGRPLSMSSEETISSSDTARGPTAPVQNVYGGDNDDDDAVNFDPGSSDFPPPTPETPERLKEIERNLHRRTFSDESVSTLATFATADEGPTSPPPHDADWPIPPSSESTSRPNSRPGSRPSTAIKRHSEPSSKQRRDSSSERADSGVGLDRGSTGSRDAKRRPAILSHMSPPYSAVSSPPMSPGMGGGATLLHDPATVVVNALLDPRGQPLGLKDKALLFGLVESLRKVCVKLQDEDEGQYASRMFRQGVEDARKALDGVLREDG